MNNDRIKRFFLVSALLIFFLLPNSAQAQAEGEGAVTLAVGTDVHYIAPALTDGGAYFTGIVEAADGKAMPWCEEITDAFTARLIEQKPDALILSGDLTFNGARESHLAFAEKLRQIESAGIPVLVLPGNHDLSNRMAARFHGDGYSLVESVDARQFSEIYAAFGYDEAVSRDSSSLSYVSAVTPKLWVLMLDVNTAEAPCTLREDTLLWAEALLKAAEERGVRVIAVSHQNLFVHNMLFVLGYVFGRAEDLRACYAGHGVLCNLSGHLHIQHIAGRGEGLPEIAVSSLVTAPFQYGVLTIEADTLSFHTEKLSFPHREDAERFFWDSSYRRALQEEADADMAAFFADVNTAYFAGRTDLLAWDEALCRRWQDRSALTGVYLRGVEEEGFPDQTRLSIPLF